MKYTIYQIPRINKGTDENIYRKYAFAPLRWIDEVNLNYYSSVYSGIIDNEADINIALEKLFIKFNLHHPVDYEGRSLSVGDIVKIDNEYYFCDSFGWVNIKFDSKNTYKVK